MDIIFHMLVLLYEYILKIVENNSNEKLHYSTTFSVSRDKPFSLHILRLKCYANKRFSDVTIYVRIHSTVW